MVVSNKIDQLDRRAWKNYENFAIDNPKAARLTAIPAAIYTLFKVAVLERPALFIDQLILLKRSIVDLRQNTDSELVTKKRSAVLGHVFASLGVLISVPVFVFWSIVATIETIYRIIMSPEKTLKSNIARANYSLFLYENRDYLKPENEVFGRSAYERFQEQISNVSNPKDVHKLNFLETNAAKASLLQEIREKVSFYEKAEQKCETAAEEIERNKNDKNEREIDQKLDHLKTAWNHYLHQLRSAPLAEVKVEFEIPAFIN